jgi:hypothetical protein
MVIFGWLNSYTMFKKNIIVFFGLLIILFSACNRGMKFDKDKWNAGDGLTFPNRNIMLDDLLQSQKLKGMKYYQVINLLHRPQGGDSTMMYYEIVRNVEPGSSDYKKNLILYLSKDSIVTATKIVETGKKK